MARLSVLALLATLAVGPAGAADIVYPPGSRVGLVPPANMVPSSGVTGFHDPRTGAAILAMELPPAAFGNLSQGFSDEALKTQGFTVRSRDMPQVGGAPAILVSGDQAAGTAILPKAVLLVGDPSVTALVIGQAPPGAPPEALAGIAAALRSVALRPPLPMADQVSALPFAMRDLAGFRPVKVIAGNSVMLTDGPADTVQGASQPVVIVAQSLGPAPNGDARDSFARTLLASNTVLKDTVVERSQAFRQGGAEWHEIVAKAKDGLSDEPVIVSQTIRFEPGGYLRAIGIVKVADRDAILPRVRRVADGLSAKAP